MPAIGDQTGRPITVRRPRKKKPPPPRPSQSFTSSPFQRPFAGQTRQGAQKVQRAVRHLPRPVVATPPVIHNPTPRQVQHAAHQIARSITRAVGTSGSNAEKIARRDAIVAQIRTDPRLHRVNRSLTHWQREQAKLIRPDAYRDRAVPGRSDKHARIGVGPLSLATINTTAGARAISNVLAAAAPGLQIRDTPAQFIRNAGGDLKTLAEGPFIGGYALGSAFVGDINESLHGGPVARRETKLVTDALRGTYQTLRHPLKSEGEHPILTPLTFAGIASSAGRVAGAGVRAVGSTPDAGGIRGAAARAGSTARSPIALGDDLGAGIVERRASKDIGRAAVQRARDRSREPLRDVEGNVVTHKGLPVLKARGDLERARLNKRRADILASRANLSERLGRDVASDELKVRGVRGRAAKDVVAMVTEGTITTARHFERDLRSHVDRLKANIARHDADVRAGRDSSVFRHEGELEKAQRRVKIGSAILSSPKALARAEAIVKAGTEHGGRLVGMERESTGAGLGNAEQFRRARLVNVAVEHMDARHGRSAKLTARAKQLRGLERTIQARLNFGHHAQPVTRLSETARKAVARNARKGQPRPPARVKVAPDVASTRGLPVERTSGTPHLPPHDVQWFHGTAGAFEGLPTAKGQWSDLGVYLTSDPHYARGYADARGASTRGRLLPIRVAPRKVLEMRAGHHSAKDMRAVLGKMRQGAEKAIQAELENDRYIRPGDRAWKQRESTLRRNWLGPLDKWDERFKSDAKLTSEQSKGLQEDLQHVSENAGDALGFKGTGGRHQLLARAIRSAGFDAIRKVDQHADALVVLDEKIMRRVTGTEGTPSSRGGGGPTREMLQNQLAQVRRMRQNVEARNTERLRTAEGAPLHPEHIEEFLRSRGRDPETVAYLPGNVSRRQFHQQFRPEQGRGMLDDKGTRTGEAHRKGATEASADLIRAAGVRQATALNKAKQVDRAIGEHGMRHPAWAKAEAGQALTKHERRVVARGGYFTGREAAEAIDRAAGRGERLVALRAYPAKLDSATQQMIRDDLQGPAAMDTLGERLINSRFLSVDELKGTGARNVVIVNEDLAKRLQQHLGAAGPLRKFGQIINRAFRYAVLPQPRWMAGNFIEPMLVRMPGVASGVNVFGMAADIRAANRVIKAMERHSDPAVRAAAQEIRAHQFGGLLIGGRGASIHRGLEDFPALNTAAQKAYGRVVAKTPAVAHMLDFSGRLLAKGGRGILKPLDLIFHLNRLGEAGLQRAAFGKSVRRDVQELTGSWAESIRLGDAAAREAAKGLVNTATQHRFMDAQHELLGKYEGFSPTTRALVQSVAPFIPWAMNAARFVFWTMPAHRTAQTAFLVQVNNVVSKDWREIHKDAPPGMRLAIPTKSGGWVDLARYTPYGFSAPIAEGDLRGIPGQFLPQVSGTEAALGGKDPFGRDLQFSKGQGSNLAVAGNELLEALVPYLSTARRLQEHGETAFADSTVLHPRTKEGTAHGMSGVERTFSPIRPTYLAGSTTDEPVSTPGPSRPATRREALLQRRARVLQGRPGVSGRTQELLRRRAALLRHP